MDRQVTPPKLVTSSTWGTPPPRRACLHVGEEPQVGEVTRLGGVTRLSIKTVILI